MQLANEANEKNEAELNMVRMKYEAIIASKNAQIATFRQELDGLLQALEQYKTRLPGTIVAQ